MPEDVQAATAEKVGAFWVLTGYRPALVPTQDRRRKSLLESCVHDEDAGKAWAFEDVQIQADGQTIAAAILNGLVLE